MLDLGHNFLDDEAIEVIARGLEKNRVLTSLILQGNGIGEKVRCIAFPGAAVAVWSEKKSTAVVHHLLTWFTFEYIMCLVFSRRGESLKTFRLKYIRLSWSVPSVILLHCCCVIYDLY